MSRKVGSILVICLLVVSLVGCSSQETTTTKEQVKIGIIQIVEHPALDAAREGFIKALADKGYEEGKEVIYDYQNAQGDMSTAQTIAKQFSYDDLDLILAIATPTAQAVSNAVKDKPILITAVTDPKTAGLVDSLDQPGGNLTGTSNLTPVRKQLKLLKQLDQNIKRVGILYNAGESNSVVQVKLARKVAKDLNLELVEATVSSSNEVYQSAQSLVGRVDGIYLPTDNTVVSAVKSVIKVAEKNNLPLISGESNLVESGALATVGIDHNKLGYQTGKMAIKVLQGADPGKMPIGYLNNTDLVINLKAANNMGVEVPQKIIDKAKTVIK